MVALTTKEFQIHIAEQFIESLTEPANNNYYMFVGKSLTWNNDSSPPEPENTTENLTYTVYDNMIFGKLVDPDDVKLMANRYDWQANTIFDFYDDRVDLNGKKFFTVVDNGTSFNVFKCLSNNNGSPSTVAPDFNNTSPADEFYQTSDGYQWKFLYSIDSATFNRFATSDFIPYEPNVDVSANAVSGAIDCILVDNPGNQLNSYANGFFVSVSVAGNNYIHTIEASSSANTDFYKDSAVKIIAGRGAGQQRVITNYIVLGNQKNIVIDSPWITVPDNTSKYEITPNVKIEGDGTGAQARAIINPSSNTVSYIEITSRGQGYTWANATVQANTGFIANTIINTVALRPIIGPAEGHGGNIPYELGMSKVGISTAFANTELGTIPATNKFRTVGLIRDPLFANVELSITDVNGIFVDGEEVICLSSSASGKIKHYDEANSKLSITDYRGIINSTDIVKGLSSNSTAEVVSTSVSGKTKNFNTFDQRLRFDVTYSSGNSFPQNELVVQNSTSANGYVHESNNSFVALTNTKNEFESSSIMDSQGTVANIITTYEPDVIKSSGKILYIENTQPIQRSNTSTETIKVVIGFD